VFEKQKEIFSQILNDINQSPWISPEEKLVAFRAIEGNKARRDLMVVGRALNGGGTVISKEQLGDKLIIQKFADDIVEQKQVPENWISLRWVAEGFINPPKEYNPRKSAFWRVIKEIVESLKIAETNGNDEWSSFLLWSNLYKFSPYDGGNPSGKLMEIQREKCVELLSLEIETWKPKNILMLTGGDWLRRFLKGSKQNLFKDIRYLNDGSHRYEYLDCVGDLNYGGKIAVAKHPERKKGDIWVEEVLNALKD